MNRSFELLLWEFSNNSLVSSNWFSARVGLEVKGRHPGEKCFQWSCMLREMRWFLVVFPILSAKIVAGSFKWEEAFPMNSVWNERFLCVLQIIWWNIDLRNFPLCVTYIEIIISVDLGLNIFRSMKEIIEILERNLSGLAFRIKIIKLSLRDVRGLLVVGC